MEELKNSMKEMVKKMRKDESDKYLYFSPKYSRAVKISDWYLPLEAEPKDNDPYNPPGGNYFMSTHKRFGTQDTPMVTTTQAMLQQICSERLDIRVHKPLVNLATEQILKEEIPVDYKRPLFVEDEFTTTYSYDYRHPFPYRKVHRSKFEDKPERRFALISKFFPARVCETKFLDDELFSKVPEPAPILIPPYETHDTLVF